jgi:hypothetical protein
VLLALALAVAALALAGPALANPALGSWSETGSGLGAQTGVSCPSFGLCVSVADMNANVSTAPTTAATWHQEPISGLPAASALSSVSCAPGSAFCVAVGTKGAVAVNANVGTAGWSALSAQDSSHNLTSVSCPSTGFCFAVDSSGGAIYSTNEGSTWTAVSPGHTLTAVACGSSGQCAGIDGASHIYASTSPTTSTAWTSVATDANADLVGIACAANNTCVAVDGSGLAWATSTANSLTQTWSQTPVAGSLSAVTCTPDGVCVATGTGSAYASDDPAGGSPSWSSSTLPTTATAVSCTDQGLCAAVDGAGGAYVSTFPTPSATTGAGTAASQTTATLTATVNPQDATLTNCYFEYGTTSSYGASVPCSSTPSSTGGSQSVSAQISGLAGGTTYHFQVVASNAVGSGGGGDETFTTPAPLKPSPSISGVAAVGDTLTCAIGVTLPPGASASYTWVRDTTTIAGASGATYVVALADQTHHLYCTATISGDGGSNSGNSGYVSVPSETLGTVFETVIGAATAAARSVTVPVTCSPQAISDCAIKLTLTQGSGRHVVQLGSATAKVAASAKANVTVKLNARGRSLLARNHHLKATLTVSGTIVGVIKGTLKRETVSFTTSRHARRR